MSARRAGPPPEIPGYTPVETIGSGGFADVFLYRQALTERDVAVKVLADRLAGDEITRQFHTEANLMARLSTHPYIVTIHLAGVTGDGRPYLVMEYCSRDDLAQRIQHETLSVAEVLRIGIRVAGAVETAHRAGILHRDIKPANILTTDYGNPALTDFGISAAVHDTAGVEGLSVPWAPPEALRDPQNTTVASDVYSLAATVWHLLVGRSPFWLPQGPNGLPDLIHRISNTPVPRTGRPDVPAGLERLLSTAMAKDPVDRPASALEFARSLQSVENTAGYAETTVDIRESAPARTPRRTPVDDEPGTRVRSVVTVDPEPEVTTRGVTSPAAEGTVIRAVPTAAPSGAAEAEGAGRTMARPTAAAPLVDDTQLRARPAVVEPAPAQPEPRPGGARRLLWLGAASVLVAGGVPAAVLAGGGDEPTTPSAGATGTAGVEDEPAVEGVVPSPTELTGARGPDGSVVFTWTSPDPADGDSWVVRRADPGADDRPQLVGEPTFAVADVPAGVQACVEVQVRRSDGTTSPTPAEACAG
jgi:hypothetical protein